MVCDKSQLRQFEQIPPTSPRVAIYADVSVALFLVHRPPCNPLNSSGCPTAARANALLQS